MFHHKIERNHVEKCDHRHVVKARHCDDAQAGTLLKLTEKGLLSSKIGIKAPWTEIDPVPRTLIDRAFVGKAVTSIMG